MEGPRPLLGSSLTTANLLEECEASLSAPAPPPSLATTPERTTAEGEEQPTLNESPEHRHRRSRSLTFDPVAAQADMLRPPRTPKNASSADESDIGYTSATVPAADSSRQVSPVKHRSEDISPSSTVSEGAAPTGTQLQEPPFKPIVDGTMAPEVLVAAKRPPDVFPSSDSTSLIAPSHGHGAAADDEDPTTQPLAASHTAQTTEPDLVTTIPALKPADAYVMLESDAVRPDAASARTASSLQTLSKEAAPAQAPTLDTTKVASPEILITQASPTSQQTRQQHGPNGWDILDKELFRSRVPTPEPRDPYV